ncbi:TetR/AcrR family transcriptional regulator [Fructilactobacillus sp. Tb1]|uniref:TetR/AcrR family transcriptional regulator n=1 Tax=Fructilactobacillus sp. Tb1 TaxID=3422304 RepID=UPI003D294D86
MGSVRSKDKISDGFLELITTTHLSKITVKSITDHLHISRKTFYNNFDSIHDVIIYTEKSILDDFLPDFKNAGNAADSIATLVEILPTHLYDLRDKIKIMYTPDVRGIWYEYMLETYTKWINKNVLYDYKSRTLPKKMAASILIHDFISAIEYWISQPIPAKPEVFQKQLAVILNTTPLNIPEL